MGDSLDITVGEVPEPGILAIVDKIRPAWTKEQVITKSLKGGNVNRLYSCSSQEDSEQNDVILIRVYGAGTGDYVDRDREYTVMRLAHHIGIGAPVFCRFTNGMCYKFWPGKPLAESDVNDESVARATAKILAGIHLVDYKAALIAMGEEDSIKHFTTVHKIIDSMNAILAKTQEWNEELKTKITKAAFPSKTDAAHEVRRLEEELEAMKFRTSLCHNDANPNNIIVDKNNGEIHLIDWDFSGLDYPARDIAVYFGGKCISDNCTPELLNIYPDKEYQLMWIRWYLEYKAEELSAKDKSDVTEEEVHHWYKGSIVHALAWTQLVAHYFLMQASLSKPCSQAFEQAQHFQSLYRKIKEVHYNPLHGTASTS